MEDAYAAATEEDFCERLLPALGAGQVTGGDRRGGQSAALQHCESIAAQRRLTVRVEVAKHTPPHELDTGLRTVLRQAADACGASHRDMPSGAGHDSQTMGTHVPAGMLFIPSVEGRSHSPAEYSTPGDCARGATILATALRVLAC